VGQKEVAVRAADIDHSPVANALMKKSFDRCSKAFTPSRPAHRLAAMSAMDRGRGRIGGRSGPVATIAAYWPTAFAELHGRASSCSDATIRSPAVHHCLNTVFTAGRTNR
jgi:hypothetical protein